jgi:hypothetical protein
MSRRRQRSKWAKSERNRIEAPFAPFPCEMIESAAFRALSGSALKMLFHLTAVWARSGGVAANTNGTLIATYEQFHRCWGMDSHTAAAALRQLKVLGFVEVKYGCAGNANERQPNQFRLTFLPAEGTPGIGTHEWRRIAPDDAKRIANEAQNTPGDGPPRVRRETDETDKFKIPVGACNGFHREKSPSEGVTSVSNETDFPRGKIPRIYRSRPEGLAEHSATTPGHDAPPDAPAPVPPRPARPGPPLCESCGAAVRSRRSDARFCSARCRLRAHRQREMTNDRSPKIPHPGVATHD